MRWGGQGAGSGCVELQCAVSVSSPGVLRLGDGLEASGCVELQWTVSGTAGDARSLLWLMLTLLHVPVMPETMPARGRACRTLRDPAFQPAAQPSCIYVAVQAHGACYCNALAVTAQAPAYQPTPHTEPSFLCVQRRW